MGEIPSSRKRHRWSLERGDLVEVLRPERAFGVILVVYSANVYEGSSAEVLVGGTKVLIESKYLTRIDEDPDISAIS